jgi:hypothetical protein
MTVAGNLAGPHMAFCIAEMLAELDQKLAEDQAVRALAQLEAREARGEPISALCGASLKAALQRRIAQNPLTIARRKLLEIAEVLEVAADRRADGPPAPEAGTVIALAPARAAAAERAERRSAPTHRVGRIVAAACLSATLLLASAFQVGAPDLASTVDRSVENIARALPIRHALLLEAW